jgi:hypothetical protein
MFQTQRKVEDLNTFNTVLALVPPRSRQLSPGHMNCFSDFPYPCLIPEGHINRGGDMLHHTQHTCKQRVQAVWFEYIQGPKKTYNLHKAAFFINYVKKGKLVLVSVIKAFLTPENGWNLGVRLLSWPIYPPKRTHLI